MERVRLYEIPACRMISSGCGMFGDGTLEKFMEWMSAQPKGMFPKDFLWFDAERQGFVWYYMAEGGVQAPEDFETLNFPGGLYAVCSGKDGDEADAADAKAAIDRFIAACPGLMRDFERAELGNITTSPAARDALGYDQMDYYAPVRKTE